MNIRHMLASATMLAAFVVTPAAAAEFTTLYSFTGNVAVDGKRPEAGLLLDAAGNLYGTTYHSGVAPGGGTVFRLGPDGSYDVLLHFGQVPGDNPRGDLILDAAGNLYGTTTGTNQSNYGTVFKLSANGDYSLLHSFSGTDGADPWGGLLLDAAGNFYGTTRLGGDHNGGTIFKLTADGDYSLLHSFGGTDSFGANIGPRAGLIADAAGNLYGTSYGGGAYGYGTVFKLGDVGFALPSIDPGVPGVPEPATWTMLIAGFGLIGGALRRRRVAHA